MNWRGMTLLQDFLENDEDDEDEYFGDEQDQVPNQHGEQNNNEHIYDTVDNQPDEQKTTNIFTTL